MNKIVFLQSLFRISQTDELLNNQNLDLCVETSKYTDLFYDYIINLCRKNNITGSSIIIPPFDFKKFDNTKIEFTFSVNSTNAIEISPITLNGYNFNTIKIGRQYKVQIKQI